MLEDLVLLLRLDVLQSFRVRGAKGSRTKQKSIVRRMTFVIAALVIAPAIAWMTVNVARVIGWGLFSEIIAANLGIGAALFNAILLFSFLGSIMLSATTVGNSKRMEYMLIMPLRMRVLFMEKAILITLYSSVFWLVFITPVFVGLSLVSTSPLALLSAPAFILLFLALLTIGTSAGGLLGLGFSRIVAGRRRLKQVGYFIGTSAAILGTFVYYYTFYSGEGSVVFFEWLFALAERLGFSSELTPGGIVSRVSLGVLVGYTFSAQEMLAGIIFWAIACALVYANGYVSEVAHYSGWLATESVRTSKKEVVVKHPTWEPRSIPGFRFNSTISVSIWYNITNIRREARVFANYLMGPLRYVVFLFIPVFGASGTRFQPFIPFLVVATIIPFVTAYGLYFAGYETVYEGKNIMNLQLAAANMSDYVKGKVYSAVPFASVASIAVTTLVVIIEPTLLVFAPLIVVAAVFTNLASGAIAANAAAIGGDFRAERMFLRQRGSAVQMPIRGWSILRAQMLPGVIGMAGLASMLLVGILIHPVAAYVVLVVYSLICWKSTNQNSYSAGLRLAQKEASEYL
ncbi:MAG: hypothetical protein HXY34_01250 [Candidatus Thorarchaeota archaeon]|nr:hypothetical protein [Candidatus Thorarchaeota archaeon]